MPLPWPPNTMCTGAGILSQVVHTSPVFVPPIFYTGDMVRSAIEEDALSFLRESLTMVVATVGEQGPHASVVYYAVDDMFSVFFLTKQNTHKNIDTAFNSRVALVFGFGPEKLSVQLQGEACVLLGKEKEQVVASMLSRYTKKGIDVLPIEHLADLREKRVVAIKVTPVEASFLNMEGVRYPRSVSSTIHRLAFKKRRRRLKFAKKVSLT